MSVNRQHWWEYYVIHSHCQPIFQISPLLFKKKQYIGGIPKLLTFHLLVHQLGSLRIHWWYTETVNISFTGTPARNFENTLIVYRNC